MAARDRAGPAAGARPRANLPRFRFRWYERVRHELRPRTRRTYFDELRLHVLPFFADHGLSEITVEEVDRYRVHKVREAQRRRDAIAAGKPDRDPDDGHVLRPLTASSINKTITRLGQILEDAVEYGHIATRPAGAGGDSRQRRRHAPTSTAPTTSRHCSPPPVRLTVTLARTGDTSPRRALLATLTPAGLRISEALELRWREVDLAVGRISVRASKTDAGVRVVRLLPAPR